jgi:hypothetical protein
MMPFVSFSQAALFFIVHGQAKRVTVQQIGPLIKIELVGWLVELVG